MSGALQAVFQNHRSSGEPSWVSLTAYGATGYAQRAISASGVYSGNAVYGGYIRGADAYDKAAFAFYNTSGTLQWSKSLNTGNYMSSAVKSSAFDSSGNVYVVGYDETMKGWIYKLDSSGTTLSKYYIGFSTYDGINDIKIDSSGNIYIFGKGSLSGQLVIMKLDSSFTIQWQRAYRITGASPAAVIGRISVDASGNVYGTFSYQTDGSDIYEGNPCVIKYNSSGTFQWIRSPSGTGLFKYVQSAGGAVADSSGNVYFSSNTYDSAHSAPVITKFNSSGTMQWCKYTTAGNYGYNMAIDSSDNIYFAQGDKIYKMTTAGVITWANTLTSGSAEGLTIDSGAGDLASIYASMYKPNNWVTWKLRSNGTGTGSYTVGSETVSYVAASTTMVDFTSTIVINTPSFTSSTPSYTLTSSSYNLADAGFTASTTSLN